MTTSMVGAISVFLITYAAIAFEKLNRTVAAVAGAAVLLALNILSPGELLRSYVHWETLGLLFGMFVLVTALSEAGFFSWLALVIARALDYHPLRLFVAFPLLTGLLAAFMDSITVMLFFATLTYELSRLLRFDPVPMVVAEVVTANIGGAATLVGDPPNVILGMMHGYTFNDFAVHNGPLALLALLCAIGVAFWLCRGELIPCERSDRDELCPPEPLQAITDARLFRVGVAAFCTAVFLLVIHSSVERALRLPPVTAPLASLLPAVALLAVLPDRAKRVAGKVHYDVFLFLIGLFAIVGGLEKTGAIRELARIIGDVFRDQHLGLASTLMWFSAASSAIVDNVPFALSMGYVIGELARQAGAPALSLMVWAVSLGTDIGGNLTPIGASANVVAYTTLERLGHPIGWGRWLRLALLPTLGALLVSNLGLAVKLWARFF